MIGATGLPSKSLKWALSVCTARNDDIVIHSFQGALCGLMNREDLWVPSFFKTFWCALCYFSIRSWGFIKSVCLPIHFSGPSSLTVETEPPRNIYFSSLGVPSCFFTTHAFKPSPFCMSSRMLGFWIASMSPVATSILCCSGDLEVALSSCASWWLTSQKCPELDVELLVG